MPDPLVSTRDVDQFNPQPTASGDATIARDDQTLPVELPKNAEGGGLAFAPPEHAGEIGKLGRYRVLKELGRGGMGAVFLGYDSELQRKVALKIMLPKYAADADSRERFLREARSAAMVKSDHVVTIFDVGQEQGIPFIAMDYLLGSPLDQYLKTKGNLPLAHALRIGRETALGLAAAHELGLVHRDIKPGNLWLEAPRGRVKLLDFGLARAQSDDLQITYTGALVGTPAYMSPEQARGEKVDCRSDLFSLGVLLYRLTTGEMPFQGSTTMALLTSLAVDSPAPIRQLRPELPEELESLLARLLAKNPHERVQSAQQVAEALRSMERATTSRGAPRAAAEPLAISVQTQYAWKGIDASQRRRGPTMQRQSAWPAVAAGSVLLAVLAAFGAIRWLNRPSDSPPPRSLDTSGDAILKAGGSRRSPTGPAPQRDIAADPDRRAAEYVLAVGGWVQIDDKVKITSLADLPRRPYALKVVNLYRNEKVTDAGLATFRNCRNLTYLVLQGTNVSNEGLVHFKDCLELSGLNLSFTTVGDAGLANFKNCNKLNTLALGATRATDGGMANFKDYKNLKVLLLDGVQVGDVGLAQVKDCNNLTQLDLTGTQVSDVGLAEFKDCPNLTSLKVTKTNVSARGIEAFCQSLPQCRIEWDGGVIEPTVVADPDRQAAEYVLSIGGWIQVNGERNEISAVVDLPKNRFSLTGVFLAYNSNVTDAGLVIFKDCKSLTHLDIGFTKVSDSGLVNFKDCKDLLFLSLTGTRVGDVGLAHFRYCKQLTNISFVAMPQVGDAGLQNFKDCKNLQALWLEGTPAGDEGLTHFKDCKRLTDISVKGTKVTAPAISEFAKAQPQCRIEWDGGVIEPTVIADADRKAAEWVLANGGTVKVDDREWEIKSRSELPQDRFLLTAVMLRDNMQAIDDELAVFQGCTHLTSLYLWNTQVSDAGLVHFQACHDLKYLNFGRTRRVGDAGLSIFKDCKGLISVQLNDTAISSAGLAHFQDCKDLTALLLYRTQIGDAGVTHFKGSNNLRRLDLGETRITDAGLACFVDCNNLESLALSWTAVGDVGLAHFEDCKGMTFLNLYGTRVTDVGLARFKDCKLLTDLNVQETMLTARGIAEFARVQPQCRILWDGGTIETRK